MMRVRTPLSKVSSPSPCPKQGQLWNQRGLFRTFPRQVLKTSKDRGWMPLSQIHSTSAQASVIDVAIASPQSPLGSSGAFMSTRYKLGLHPPAPNLVEHPSNMWAEELLQGPSRTASGLATFLHEDYSDWITSSQVERMQSLD